MVKSKRIFILKNESFVHNFKNMIPTPFILIFEIRKKYEMERFYLLARNKEKNT